MENDAPCKDCEFRSVGCHATCEVYKDWRANRDKQIKEAWEAKKLNAEYLNYRECLFSKVFRQKAREGNKHTWTKKGSRHKGA